MSSFRPADPCLPRDVTRSLCLAQVAGLVARPAAFAPEGTRRRSKRRLSRSDASEPRQRAERGDHAVEHDEQDQRATPRGRSGTRRARGARRPSAGRVGRSQGEQTARPRREPERRATAASSPRPGRCAMAAMPARTAQRDGAELAQRCVGDGSSSRAPSCPPRFRPIRSKSAPSWEIVREPRRAAPASARGASRAASVPNSGRARSKRLAQPDRRRGAARSKPSSSNQPST